MNEMPKGSRRLSDAALQDALSILAEAWVLEAGRKARKRRLKIIRRLIATKTADTAARAESGAFILGLFGVSDALARKLER